MPSLSDNDMREILKMFEDQLNLLIRMDKLEKMDVRKKIMDVILPIFEMDIHQPKIIMEIVEDKLHDVFDLFIDGYEFKKKLAREINEKLKD
jgi:hypothetical protein